MMVENARAYKCPLCPHDVVHLITRKEKHTYLTRSISCVAILIKEISNYPCLNAASTSDHFSTMRMQYKMVKALTRIYKISVFRLLAHNLKPVHIISDHDFFAVEGPLKHFERSTIIINLCCYISDHLELLLNEIIETDNEKMWMEKYDNSLILFNRISIWLNKFIAMKHSDQCGSCYYNQNLYNTILIL